MQSAVKNTIAFNHVQVLDKKVVCYDIARHELEPDFSPGQRL